MEAETERTSLLRGPSKSGNKAVKQRHHRRRHHGYDAIKRQEKKESVRIPMFYVTRGHVFLTIFILAFLGVSIAYPLVVGLPKLEEKWQKFANMSAEEA